MAIPGWRTSSPADTTPITKPSSSANVGAVIGDHCFLCTVIQTRARATSAQIKKAVSALLALRGLSDLIRAQLQSALAATQKRRKPARWIVPLSVIFVVAPG